MFPLYQQKARFKRAFVFAISGHPVRAAEGGHLAFADGLASWVRTAGYVAGGKEGDVVAMSRST